MVPLLWHLQKAKPQGWKSGQWWPGLGGMAVADYRTHTGGRLGGCNVQGVWVHDSKYLPLRGNFVPQGVNFNVCELKVNGPDELRSQDGCRANQRINCITNTDTASAESGEGRSGPKLGWTRTLQTELTEHHGCRWWSSFQEETGSFHTVWHVCGSWENEETNGGWWEPCVLLLEKEVAEKQERQARMIHWVSQGHRHKPMFSFYIYQSITP